MNAQPRAQTLQPGESVCVLGLTGDDLKAWIVGVPMITVGYFLKNEWRTANVPAALVGPLPADDNCSALRIHREAKGA